MKSRPPRVLSQILNYSRNYLARRNFTSRSQFVAFTRLHRFVRCDCSLLYRDSSITSALVVAVTAAAAAVTTCNNSKCITPWDAQLRAITP